MTPPTNRSFTAGHFELIIDGHKATTYLKSVEGGSVKGNVSDDGIGATSGHIKQISSVEIEPMSIELGMSGSKQILEWIQGSWNRQWSRRSGQITHADFNLRETYEHWFYEALLTEVTFPTLDATAKEPAYLKCKFLPENIMTKKAGGGKKEISGQFTPKQKMWIPSAFRFSIDQFDGMEYTSKIESFTIKQGIKKMFIGSERYPQIEPTKIEFPNISGLVSLSHADRLLKWHQDYVVNEKGTKDPKAQLSGAIEFLTPDRASTIFRIELAQVGVSSCQIQQATANNDQIKRVKFDMFVGSMKLDGAGGLGLE